MPWTAPDLRRRLAVVTGATRGVGKGIALVLGECGATVVVTGRTTVDEAAAEVDARGGRGIPVQLDHTDDDAVEQLFGTLPKVDLLVANAWGGYEDYDSERFTAPFWEQPVERFDVMFNAGLRAQFTTARAAAPLMLEAGRGLIVLTGFPGRTHYLGQLPYDVIKAGVDRMVSGLAHELRPHGVAAVGVWPGFTRTEAVVESFAAGGEEPPPETHSVEFPGRAVAMLAADAELASLNGARRQAAEWAEHYGFEDVDGRTIAPFSMPESLRLGGSAAQDV
jgi:NAD(P)-dependent dehydrogenase (short-subunit alcohol dehydrogenase family)